MGRDRPRPAAGRVIAVLSVTRHDGGMRVLVVEDNEMVAQAITAGLRDRGRL
jgi:hypothetical protein